MTDENDVMEQPEEEQGVTAADYVAELDRIKKDMISKSEYERVLRENKTLADSLARGGSFSQEEEKITPERIQELRNKLYGTDPHYRNNMDFFSDLLELRQGIIETEGVDPFLPHNKSYVATDADHAKADYIAQQIGDCLESADGDPQLFNAYLMKACGESNKKIRR